MDRGLTMGLMMIVSSVLIHGLRLRGPFEGMFAAALGPAPTHKTFANEFEKRVSRAEHLVKDLHAELFQEEIAEDVFIHSVSHLLTPDEFGLLNEEGPDALDIESLKVRNPEIWNDVVDDGDGESDSEGRPFAPCRKSVRSTVAELKDALDDVREVTRHPNFSTDLVRHAMDPGEFNVTVRAFDDALRTWKHESDSLKARCPVLWTPKQEPV